MKMTLRLDHVSQIVSQTLLDLGASEQAVARVQGTVLEDAGERIAKRYRADNLIAMWIIDQHLIRIYNTHGQLLRTVEIE